MVIVMRIMIVMMVVRPTNNTRLLVCLMNLELDKLRGDFLNNPPPEKKYEKDLA